jgi:ABC-type multidrug transport system ATPase subunit
VWGEVKLSSTPIVKADHLVLKRGSTPLIQDLSFELGKNLMLGIVSKNRLAVRSLIFALAGYLPWNGGYLGYVFSGQPEVRGRGKRISSFSNELTFPPKLRVREILGLSGADSLGNSARVQELSSLLQLDELLGRRWEQLSHPVRSRVQLATCLAKDEELFILDYLPSDIGDDYRTIVRNYLSSLTALGKTVIMATDEPENLCDIVLLIRGPSSSEFGNADVLRRRLVGPGRFELTVSGLALQSVEDRLVQLGASWIYTGDDRLVVSCTNDKPMVEQLISEVTANGGVVEGVRVFSSRLIDAARGTM